MNRPNTSSAVKNLIFDLGGLFIDVYMHRFRESLEAALGRSVEHELRQLQQEGFFDAYETGKIGTTDFLQHLQQQLDPSVDTQAYVDAWNAILGQVQLAQLQLVQPLRQQYQVVLLSNTNELHVQALEKEFYSRHPYPNLEPFFDRVFYSQRIGLRKPDEVVFMHVLNQMDFDPTESLFVDDSPGHLQGAAALGIHTYLHPQNAPLRPSLQQIGLPI
jgi:HAD superfamily hydrolase (TIGR01509 family)